MRKHFLTDLSELLNPVIDDRVEQVQLEVERNPDLYPEHALHFSGYKKSREVFEHTHPALLEELEMLISDIEICYSDIGIQIYRQGARDCAAMLLKLFYPDDASNGAKKE